jgi:hypothetical protein
MERQQAGPMKTNGEELPTFDVQDVVGPRGLRRSRLPGAAAGLFLHLNGWRLNAEPDDAEPFVLGVASGKLKKEEIRIWLERPSAPLRKRRGRQLALPAAR